ncbi:MAG: TerB family tellurite resistance protein [Bacteroidia bacterium]
MSFRIIGALIGFFSSGFFGAIVGFMIGSYVDYAYGAEETTSYNQGSFNSYGGYQTNQVHPSDFKNSLLILIAAVMKADGVAMKSELDLVKSMLLRTYGEQESRNMLLQLREYLKKEHNLNEVCRNLRNRMSYSPRLELVHILFRISRADGVISDAEISLIQQVATQLGVSHTDYLSLKAMFVESADADFKILDVSNSASEDEVKKAYRKLAMRFHPDRLQGLSEGEKKSAETKFLRVQKAYENIKKKKGWK